MTEQEWLDCTDPDLMGELLGGYQRDPGGARVPVCIKGFLPPRGSNRKGRLLHCASCRKAWPSITDPRSRAAVVAAEAFADGEASEEEYERAQDRARAAWSEDAQECGAAYLAWRGGFDAAAFRVFVAEEYLAALLRDIYGNPFRPLPPPGRKAALRWYQGLEAWSEGNEGAALRVARAAYAERVMPEGTLDPLRLSILADALEEAGCTETQILDHLRGPGPHVRGCFALDLVLGRR
jgi:hypothetical protein